MDDTTQMRKRAGWTLIVCAVLVTVLMGHHPIGSGQGIRDEDRLLLLRERFPKVNLLVDAGIGVPSHAARAMELGCDAVLLNTAIAKAADPVAMARGFRHGVEAGRLAYEAGAMEPMRFATASSPTVGVPFWHQR